MPRYKSWTVEIRNHTDIELLLDDEPAAIFFSDKSTNTTKNQLVQSTKITALSYKGCEGLKVYVCAGNRALNLKISKFKNTVLFGQRIDNVDSLMKFWENMSGFLRDDEDSASLSDSSVELLTEMETGTSSKESYVKTVLSTNDTQTTVQNGERNTKNVDISVANRTKTTQSVLYTDNSQMKVQSSNGDRNIQNVDITVADRTNTSVDDMPIEIKNTTHSRETCIDNICEKRASCELIDIYDLSEPPAKYRIRDPDISFVSMMADQMIEKQSISIDNAPTVIGLIDIHKREFKPEKLSEYKIYIIDGNHSIKAQKEAYNRTKDPIFRFREVNIYCGLTPEEAIFLGVSRNEDTSSFVKFTDFQKVDLLRRRLYLMTNVSDTEEPPAVPKQFRDEFICLLNLKGKVAVDGKNILRFLSTSLSNRCYTLYRHICSRRSKLVASKFECLRGLSEEDAYNCLLQLHKSELQKEDWQVFTSVCLEKRKKRKARKDVMVTVIFEDCGTTGMKVGLKPTSGNCICFKFCKNDETVIMTSRELQDLVCGTGKINMDPDRKTEYVSIDDKSISRQHKGTARKTTSCKISTSSFEDVTFVPDSPEPEEKRKSIGLYKDVKKGTGKINMDPDRKTEYVSIDNKSISRQHKGTARKTTPCKISTSSFEDVTFVPDSPEPEEKRKRIGLYKDVKKDISSPVPSCSLENVIVPLSEEYVNDFLYQIADEFAVERVRSGLSYIEEEEVETKPELLLPNAKLLLDESLQKKAAHLFTKDAWLLVKNTLSVLKGLYISQNKSKENIFCATKGKRNIYSFSSDVSPVKAIKDCSKPVQTQKRIESDVDYEKDAPYIPVSSSSPENGNILVLNESVNSLKRTVSPIVNEVNEINEGKKERKRKSCRVRLTDIALVNDVGFYTSKWLKRNKKQS